ncbi:hypothetical protein ACRQFD_06485 [Actinotignum sp. GS-2025c]|uniref:hypothetical protein n=1 Tax=unclassified Actinotignum TaxID=2632702 RepID=UPI003F45A6F6
MQPEEHASITGNAGHAGNETPAVPASNTGMDRNTGWNMLTSFINRMKEKEQNGTWQSYRNPDTSEEDEEGDTDG